MKILYVSSFDSRVKSGYYRAVNERLGILKDIYDDDIYSVNFSYNSQSSTSGVSRDILIPYILRSHPLTCVLLHLFIFFKLVFIMARIKPAVVHVHWAYPVGYSSVLLKSIFKVKVVLSVHGSDIHTHPFRRRHIHKYTKIALEKADVIISVGKGLSNIMIEKFNITSSKIINSANGVEVPIDSEHMVTSNNNTLSLIYIGNLNYTKGSDFIPVIIEKLLNTWVGNVELSIVGDGELKQEIESTLVESCRLSSCFYGRLPNGEALRLLANSDVSLLPSRAEGFGISLVESMALGVPCVSFSIPGLQGVYLDGNEESLQSVPFDTEDFAKRIVKAYNSSCCIDSDKYKLCYSWKKIVTDECKLYKSL